MVAFLLFTMTVTASGGPLDDITTMNDGVFIPQDTFTFVLDTPVNLLNDSLRSLIRADQASTRFPTITGAGHAVAIVDTGVDAAHPALAGRVVAGYNATGIGATTNYDDDYGHGTHVAGISASNDATYTGLVPQADIVAVKVLDSSGSGTWEGIEAGLQWVIDNRVTHNIVAVNMSLGTSSVYNTDVTSLLSDELAALKNAGVFIAVSSGNEWYANMPDHGVAYPAADPSTVAVGSVWSDSFGGVLWGSGAIDRVTEIDRIVSHTNRSLAMLDILAPGALITSANNDWETGDDFVSMGGTSMAAPGVSGMAVLIRQAIEENWPVADWPTGAGWQDTILQIMQDYGEMIMDGDDEDDNVINLCVGFSRIDALGALTYTTPEPATLVVLSFGGLTLLRRRRRT